MKTYILSESELANFSDDNVRAEIRGRVSAEALKNETVNIQSVSGDVYDIVSGSIPFDGELAVALTDEQLAERREIEEANSAEILRIETEIKPLVMQRLRVLARHEMRDEIHKAKTEILELRAALSEERNARRKLEASLERKPTDVRNEISSLRQTLVEKNRELEMLKKKEGASQ